MVRTLVPLVAVLLSLVAPSARALTVVAGGNIGTETWTAAGNPYIVQGDVTVTGSLTIQPGVVVQFAPTDSQAAGVDLTRVELVVQGNLQVANNVVFQSQIGGAMRGLWYGIRIQNGSASFGSGVSIRNAVNGLHVQSAPGMPSPSGLDLQSASECGIRYDSGAAIIQNTTATNLGAAICLSGATFQASISGLVVTDSTHAVRTSHSIAGVNYSVNRLRATRLIEAVSVSSTGGSGNLSIDSALFTGNNIAIATRAAGTNVTVRNATIANNRTSIAATFPGQVVVLNSQVTYHQNPPQVTNGAFLIFQHSNYFQSGQEQLYTGSDGMRSGEPMYAGVTPHDYFSGTGNFQLTPSSTGANRGLNGLSTSPTDLDGLQRPFAGGTVDMGAFELQAPAVQSLNFPGIPNQFASAAPIEMQATATSGLPILYVSQSPLVCSVAGNVLTIIGRNGFCDVHATQPGNGEWLPSNLQGVSFLVFGAVPRIQVAPAQLDFGTRALGSSTTLPVTVRNAGYVPLTFNGTNFTGNNPFMFGIAPDCPPVLQEQQECVLYVIFNPTSFGTFSANLLVASGDPVSPQVFVPLAGAVQDPDVTPDPFVFNAIANATPGAVQVSNAVTITGIDFPALIVVTNGEFSVGCNGTFQTFMGTVSNGQTVCVRHTAPLALNATTNTTVQMGGMTVQFTSTTIATLPPAGDYDSDGIPNAVEASEGRNPLVKDNDIFANTRLFAMQMYRDFLGREADAGGIDFYVDLVGSGAASREEIIASFLASPEFSGGLPSVIRLYFSFFDRIPDAGGLQFQVDAFRAGTPIEVIAQNFYNSPEFTSRYGALTNDAYIDLVYQNVLGRAPDAGGFAFYKNLLDTGAITKGQMMIGFSESPEFQQITTNEVYTVSVYFGLLRRTPEAAGLDFYADLLDQGLPRVQVLPGFFNSAEYRNRFLP